MTDQERLQLGKRVKRFDALTGALAEVRMAVAILRDGKEFTMNTSQIRNVTGILIEFDDAKIQLGFSNINLRGYEVARALQGVLDEIEGRLVKELKEL